MEKDNLLIFITPTIVQQIGFQADDVPIFSTASREPCQTP